MDKLPRDMLVTSKTPPTLTPSESALLQQELRRPCDIQRPARADSPLGRNLTGANRGRDTRRIKRCPAARLRFRLQRAAAPTTDDSP
jgi:hypothetical protein